MKENTYLNLKNYFKQEIANIKQDKITTDCITKLNLNNLHPEQQILKLHAELISLEKDLEDSPCKEYILFADNLDHLHRLFFTKIALHKQNDTEKIKDVIILKEKITGIQKLLKQKKEEIKKFTLKDLKAGQNNVIFYQLKECPTKTDPDEYTLMRLYQSQTILKALEAEFNQLQHTFINNSKNNFPECLKQEIKYCKNVNLKKLLALKDSESPLKEHSSYIKHHLQYDEEIFQIPLSTIKEHLKKHATKEELSCPQLFCLAFNKYYYWLLTLKSSQTPQLQNTQQTDYSDFFEKTYSLTIEVSQKLINRLNHYNDRKHIPVLIKKLEKLESYSLINRWPLLPLTEDKKPALKTIFYNHLILNPNSNNSTSQLFLAIQTNIFFRHYYKKLKHLYKKYNIKNTFSSTPQILDLLSFTAPNINTFNHLYKTLSVNTAHLLKHDLPYISIQKDINNTVTEIFNQTADNLEKLYSNNDINTNVFHAIIQKKDLLRIIYHNKRYNIPTPPQVQNLLDIFESVITEFHELQNTKPIDLENIIIKDEPTTQHQNFSFNYSKSDTSILENITALTLHLNFLANNTSSRKFVRIITAQNLDLITDKIYLNCQTTHLANIAFPEPGISFTQQLT